ncbi:hypothetical protein ACM66Z_06340 [Sulfurovum sp. ST-21]|uniref:Lipoprotein n=1 Tax=Sulfurovum indicum TaxID=2779528 RepID=A0A7M1S128_9BACT|nr:hypothetical protein [Sulfurovum indicum]QOR61076.1 hypothetical protein IMZ28_06295 [Sulfurovum indicum]
MIQKISLFILTAALLAGCSPSMTSLTASKRYEKPTPEKEEKFQEVMIKVAQSTQENPIYHRMALNSPEEKEWFKDLMYRLWDRQITRKEFIAEGTAKYPDHIYEFSYIANAYQRF